MFYPVKVVCSVVNPVTSREWPLYRSPSGPGGRGCLHSSGHAGIQREWSRCAIAIDHGNFRTGEAVFGTHDLLLFILSGLLLNITPGPDSAYIVGRSTQLGWKGGATAALGIGAGGLVHVTAAAFGISALLATSATAFTAVKLLGATYLVYLGARMFWARRNGNLTGKSLGKPFVSLAVVFRQGFITNVLNPKVALFFLAFLPQFIDTDAPSKVLAFLMLGLVFDFNGTLWNILVAGLSARVANKVRNMGQLHRWIDRALGTLFIYIGIRLAVGERG
jgi:threonine/homoserine/homoserine lactone efflux protein